MPSGKTTTDHDEIRRWVEERGGHPATVRGTGQGGEEAGLLRIDFPGYSGGDRLEEISWDEFFQKFDEEGLAFVYEDRTSGGKTSRFSKLVSRDSAETADGRGRAAQAARRESGSRTSSSRGGGKTRQRGASRSSSGSSGRSSRGGRSSSSSSKGTSRKSSGGKTSGSRSKKSGKSSGGNRGGSRRRR